MMAEQDQITWMCENGHHGTTVRRTMTPIGEFQAHGTELEAQKAMYAAVDGAL